MNKRTIDEMIAHFNQEVSNMEIAREYKMALLGMITAIGYESKKQEVVRCEECRWALLAPQRKTATCMKGLLPFTHEYDFFCKDGERENE